MHMQRKQKIEKNDEEGDNNLKKQDSKSTTKNKTYLKLWVFDCDLQDALLIPISLKAPEHYLLSF